MFNKTVKEEKWLLETAKVTKMLEHCIPQKKHNVVGMLGSAPLKMYQVEHKIGPTGWIPHDFDVFVSGDDGRTPRRFHWFVNKVVKNMQEMFNVLWGETSYTMYAKNGVEICVIDVKVRGIDKNISFVQCPTCRNLLEVADGFDIDVCRVIYDIHAKRFRCSQSVMEHIKSCQAVLEGFDFAATGITKKDATYVQKTMYRMVKYRERGFHFMNGGGFRCVEKRRALKDGK